MPNRKPVVTSLRAIRKASHIGGKVARHGSRLLERVEHKAGKLITERTGSPDAQPSIPVDRYFYQEFPQLNPVHPALPQLHQKPSVTVFAFLDPKGFYGGIATLLCVGASLANRLGYDLRIAQTTGFSKDTDVLGFLESNNIHVEKERFSTVDLSKRSPDNFAYLPLHQDDILLVSAWWDAHLAAQLPLKNKFVYLIQDYEPIFYNNSDSSVLADQTYYTEKFNPICNTKILKTFFESKGYAYIAKNAAWFEPAPAPAQPKANEAPGASTKSSAQKIFLYGRPHVHRNLYYNAIRALDIALQDPRMANQDWELYSAGSAGVPAIKLRSGHTIKNLGKMDLDEYYDWAKAVDITVSPMLAPHPNYPTLELAALGSMVVSTKWETKQDLSSYSKNILMAEASAESMAEKIVEAALTKKDIRLSNMEKNNINSDWASALREPIDQIAKLYKK